MPLQKYMLPSDIESLCDSTSEGEDDNFRNLVGETLDILDSEDCHTVMNMCLDAGFSHVMSSMIPFFQVEELGKLGNHRKEPLQGPVRSVNTVQSQES